MIITKSDLTMKIIIAAYIATACLCCCTITRQPIDQPIDHRTAQERSTDSLMTYRYNHGQPFPDSLKQYDDRGRD